MFKRFLIFILCFALTVASAESLDKIVAVVNEDVITESQLNVAIAQIQAQLVQNKVANPPSEYAIREQALNQLIDQNIELQLAKKSNITISDAELNQAINNIAQQNNITVAELQNKVESESNFSFNQFKEQLRQQLLVNKLQQMALGPTLNVTQAQINAAIAKARQKQQELNEYNISDILIPLPDNPPETQINEAQKRAEDIIKQIKAGKPVNELIATSKETVAETNPKEVRLASKLSNLFKSKPKENVEIASSSDEISVQELGWRSKADLPEIFAKQINSIKVGEISKPIRTANGLHILRLNQVKFANSQALDPNLIRNQLYQEAIMKELPKWLEKMRKTAYIKINP